MMFSNFADAQSQNLSYSVRKKGEEIGVLNVSENKNGRVTNLSLSSNIKTCFVFSIKAFAKEEAQYEDGQLKQASVYQKVNGNEKLNKKLEYINNKYLVTENGVHKPLDFANISFNMICMFTQEPDKRTSVYSDKHQKQLPITRLGEGRYRVSFPDANYNDYHYNNGLCSRVEVNHSLYKVTMELKN